MYPEILTFDVRSQQHRANKKAWASVLEKFENALEQVAAEGSEKSLARHQHRGQVLPRDRIALLLDQDSPFLELGSFAGFNNQDSTPCANLIAGIGCVNGRPSLVMSHIPTQSGGAWNEMTVLKTNRMMEIAFENDLILISLVQSAGVFLPQQFRVFHKGGQLFRDLAVRTQHGKPSCAIVFGSSTAGGAYHPALSDYTIFVENQAQAFLGGPPLVKMATGEVIGAEELGGAQVHGVTTGLADQIASDEFDAIRKAREWVGSLEVPPAPTSFRLIEPIAPRYNIEDVLSIVNPDIRKPFDMREVLLRIVDDSRLSEFKPRYGKNMITAWAHIFGFPIGIVANQLSVINPTEAAKGAQFIRMCNQQNTPIIFFHNVTGFMVGAKAEHAGIIKLGAQLVSAVSCSTVPHISIILGASYGAGNYAMCGRAYRPRFIFTWPTGRCSVMGPDQLSGVMETIQKASAEAKGQNLSSDKLKKQVEEFRERAQNDAECYSTSSMLIDDGIIDPRDTRDVLGMCLEVVTMQGVKGTKMSPVRRPLFLAASPVGKDGRPIIQRLLIANRGEIAVRIIQTCRRLNIASVAVYVEEDASSRHVHDADEAICIGSVGRSDSNPFLDMDLLIQTALRAQVQAVHPGYGYLSENADFARRVRQAGLIFIGPGASAMSSLGDKRSAKEYLRKHAPDVPLIPGFAGSSQSVDVLAAAAEEIGLPVMVKASAGGGGKGMRIVREAKQLKSELERAKSEAQRAFGSSDCILEKYIECGKHVEIQIIGDRHGEVVSFLDRDCSVQRRHQKVIEETPCPFLSDETRRKMSATAVRIAKLIGYENAGTVEFVVDVTSGKFYFLEVNARLQVEHPITEEVTGFDLVSLQLFVAAGGKLQGLPTVTQQGHAIECRLCAEDPQNNFFPEHGMVHLWRPADGLLSPGRDIRYETAIHTGSEVSIYFDSMIAKIVVWAPTREMAIDKMTRVLANTACVGVKTNQLFLQRCLLHREFHRPTYTTSFIPSYFNELTQTPTTCVTGLYSIVPSVVIRTLPKPSSPARRPFQMIRSQFRNQHHDPVNVHCDIITTVNGPGATSPMMCVWQPVAAGTSRQICEVHLTPVPNDSLQPQKEADSVTTAQYNAISNGLRQKIDNSTSFHHVYMESCQMIEGYNTTSQSCNTFTTVVSINRTKILGHVVIPSISSHPVAGLVDQPQRVFCHFPSLGTWIEFQRDTLLSFGEASRSAGKAEKESQTRVILAPMPCKLLSIDKKNGDEVAAGETLMVIESMKMEVNITASISGKFQTDWKKGDAVDEGKVLCSVL
ncbi:carboxyl transferase domain-containing protein [Aspergillus bertholletiae]|uniref:acetyl-CoA carboxylase n=1 Tax=Aspergillus bertholletiae TaxID=1226010 RepID=A0A5N7AY10_9EURO|nr:carboxyl transferase domain-containing protein [Aspergillus bertholletiae]